MYEARPDHTYTSLIDKYSASAAATFGHEATPADPIPELAVRTVAAIRGAQRHPFSTMHTHPLRAEMDHLTEPGRQAAARACEAAETSIERAVLIALEAHRRHMRKDGRTPYIAHPIAIAIELAPAFGDAAVAAALVHDVVEDTTWTRERLTEALDDPKAMTLVDFATEPDKSQPWEIRKETTVTKLVDATWQQAALVIADKGYNLRDLLRTASIDRVHAFDTLSRGRDAQSWFAHALAAVVATRQEDPFDSFKDTVRQAFADGLLNPTYRHTPTYRRQSWHPTLVGI